MPKQKIKRWANLFLCLFTFVLFSPAAAAVSIYSTLDTPFYDANGGCSSAGNSGGGVISGNLQDLAQQIWDNPNITYDFGKSGPTGSQFKLLLDGKKAQTDDGREVDVQPIILITILHIAQSHKVNVSALTDGSSHTAPTNPHGSGKAVDINILDGSHTSGTDSIADAIVSSAADVLPNGARFGLGNSPSSVRQIANKSFSSFPDNPTHVHIDVMGVSQAENDAAVQAAGGSTGTSPSTSISGCCATNGSSSGTVLAGSGPGEQVFNYFIKQGLSSDSAAAVTGNLQLESANWSAIDGWGGGGGNYYGIGQWDRQNRYANLVKVSGGVDKAAKLSYQLDFVWYELHHGYESTLSNLMGNESVESKTIFWGRNYEGAITNGQLQLQDRRIAYALTWAQKTGGGGSDSSTSTTAPIDSNGCAAIGESSPSNSSGYKTPFHDTSNLVPSRIDEGVDYLAKAGTTVPVYAIGSGIVTKVADGNSTFYPKLPNWITYQLKGGVADNKYVYVAESCPPLVHEGQQINSDTLLCRADPSSIEMGWALDAKSQAAAAVNIYNEGDVTSYGVNFNQLLIKLGAPGGTSATTNNVVGKLPGGWPTW